MNNYNFIEAIGDIDDRFIAEAEPHYSLTAGKRTCGKAFLTTKNIIRLALAACIVGAVIGFTLWVIRINRGYNFVSFSDNAGKSSENYYRLDENTDPEATKRYQKSLSMINNFYDKLPYKGNFKEAVALDRYYPDSYGNGESSESGSPAFYSVGGFSANDFPGYYAGHYFDAEGKLVIIIKADYYTDNYIISDWYRELQEMLESDKFTCTFAKYNYSELLNGMSDILFGNLSVELKNAGVELWSVGISTGENYIGVYVSAEFEKRVKKILKSDLYLVNVGEKMEFTW
ncbi:MAG: hypothetical protein MJ131_03500 [Lachnospiraceae bacterium]|nr:hypothetical protein [Lachnospiraceae bacterium]